MVGWVGDCRWWGEGDCALVSQIADLNALPTLFIAHQFRGLFAGVLARNAGFDAVWETPYKKGVKSDFYDPQRPNARHKKRRPRASSSLDLVGRGNLKQVGIYLFLLVNN